MGFRFSPLNIDRFRHLFGLDQKGLARYGVQRLVVNTNPGFPCRVSLCDADVGDEVLLLNYEHQAARNAFRSSHAIFVRESANQVVPESNQVPEMFRHRLLSVRAFDGSGTMVDADVTLGEQCESLIDKLLASESAAYLHVHNAARGCYLALVQRD